VVNDVLLCLFACLLAWLLASQPSHFGFPYLSLVLSSIFLFVTICKRISAHNNNMSNAESENAVTRFEFDPDGDVLLLVGTGEKSYELLASSKVLGLASPVFRAMFTGHFQEAHDLKKKRTDNQPLRKEFPDDDSDGMLLLCSLLHLAQLEPFDQPISCTVFHNLASLGEKYDCLRSLRYIVEPLLDRAIASNINQCILLVRASYVLGASSAFERFSKELITSVSGNLCAIPAMKQLSAPIIGKLHHCNTISARKHTKMAANSFCSPCYAAPRSRQSTNFEEHVRLFDQLL